MTFSLKAFLLIKIGFLVLLASSNVGKAAEVAAQTFLELRSLETSPNKSSSTNTTSTNQSDVSQQNSTLGVPGDWTPINNWLNQHDSNQQQSGSGGNISPQLFGNPPKADFEEERAILLKANNQSQNTCMNQCSNNGICYKNQCYCHAGYVSADCSVKTSEISQDGMTSSQVLTLSTVTYFAGISFGHMLILYLTRKADEQEFMDIKPYLRPS